MRVGRRDNRTSYFNNQRSTRSHQSKTHWTPCLHNKPADNTLSDNRVPNKAHKEMWQPISKEGAGAPNANRMSWQPTSKDNVGSPQTHKAAWQPTLRQCDTAFRARGEVWQPKMKEDAHQPTGADEEIPASESKEGQRKVDSDPVSDATSGGPAEDSVSTVSSDATIDDVEDVEFLRTLSESSENLPTSKLDWADYSSDEDGFIQKHRSEMKKDLSTASQRTAKAKLPAVAGISSLPSQRSASNVALVELYDSLREARMIKQEGIWAGQDRQQESLKEDLKKLPLRDSALKVSLEKHLAKWPQESKLEEYNATLKENVFRSFQMDEDEDEGIESEEAKEADDEASLSQPESNEDFVQELNEKSGALSTLSDSTSMCCFEAAPVDLTTAVLPPALKKVIANSPHLEIFSRWRRSIYLALFAVVVIGIQAALVFSDSIIPTSSLPSTCKPMYPLAALTWWIFCGVVMQHKAGKSSGGQTPLQRIRKGANVLFDLMRA